MGKKDVKAVRRMTERVRKAKKWFGAIVISALILFSVSIIILTIIASSGQAEERYYGPPREGAQYEEMLWCNVTSESGSKSFHVDSSWLGMVLKVQYYENASGTISFLSPSDFYLTPFTVNKTDYDPSIGSEVTHVYSFNPVNYPDTLYGDWTMFFLVDGGPVKISVLKVITFKM